MPIKLLIRGKERQRGDKQENAELKPYEKAAALAAEAAGETPAGKSKPGKSGTPGGKPKVPAGRGKLLGRGVGQRRPKNLTEDKTKRKPNDKE